LKILFLVSGKFGVETGPSANSAMGDRLKDFGFPETPRPREGLLVLSFDPTPSQHA